MVSSGADIQPDKNWAKVHNSILELLASSQFTARELRCLLFLLRMTYGEREKEHAISLAEWVQGTKLKRGHVNTTLQALTTRNVITKIETGPRSKPVWAFNKYFEQWIPSTPVGTTFNGTPVGTSCSTDMGTRDSTPVGTNASTPLNERNTPVLEEKKKKGTEGGAPALPPLSPDAVKYGAFVTMHEQVFGNFISPTVANFISEWVNAVTEQEWVYALGECKARKGSYFESYVASILRRVVAERITPKAATVAPTVVTGLSIAEIMGD
jgi:phage replication O-like protein O